MRATPVCGCSRRPQRGGLQDGSLLWATGVVAGIEDEDEDDADDDEDDDEDEDEDDADDDEDDDEDEDEDDADDDEDEDEDDDEDGCVCVWCAHRRWGALAA